MNIEFDKVGTACGNGYEVGRLRTAGGTKSFVELINTVTN